MLAVLVFLQVLIGAIMRHLGAGLAIPDFPLAFGRLIPPDWTGPIAVNYLHRTGGFVVAAAAIWAAIRIFSARADAALRPIYATILGVIAVQIGDIIEADFEQPERQFTLAAADAPLLLQVFGSALSPSLRVSLTNDASGEIVGSYRAPLTAGAFVITAHSGVYTLAVRLTGSRSPAARVSAMRAVVGFPEHATHRSAASAQALLPIAPFYYLWWSRTIFCVALAASAGDFPRRIWKMRFMSRVDCAPPGSHLKNSASLPLIMASA